MESIAIQYRIMTSEKRPAALEPAIKALDQDTFKRMQTS